MFLNCRPGTLHAFALTVATLFAQGANAQSQCTLTAVPAMVSAGVSSTLTASCVPAATSFEWAGGTCTGNTGSTCTVTPAVTTEYSVIGIGSGGTSSKVDATVFTAWPSDGIYEWAVGQYLSVHRLSKDLLIATIYWVYDSSPTRVGSRTIGETDTWDLFSGNISGATATIKGTRFFRACELSYELEFNSDSTLKVTPKGVSNSPEVPLTDMNCAARYKDEAVKIIPRS